MRNLKRNIIISIAIKLVCVWVSIILVGLTQSCARHPSVTQLNASDYGISESTIVAIGDSLNRIDRTLSSSKINGNVENIISILNQFKSNEFKIQIKKSDIETFKKVASSVNSLALSFEEACSNYNDTKSELLQLYIITSELLAELNELETVSCSDDCNPEYVNSLIMTFLEGADYSLDVVTLVFTILTLIFTVLFTVLGFFFSKWIKGKHEEFNKSIAAKGDEIILKAKARVTISSHLLQANVLVSEGLNSYTEYANLKTFLKSDSQIESDLARRTTVDDHQIYFLLQTAVRLTEFARQNIDHSIKQISRESILEGDPESLEILEVQGWAYSNLAYYCAEAINFATNLHADNKVRHLVNLSEKLQSADRYSVRAIAIVNEIQELKIDKWYEMKESCLFARYQISLYYERNGKNQVIENEGIKRELMSLLTAPDIPMIWKETTRTWWQEVLE